MSMHACPECGKALSTPQGLAGHRQFKHRLSPMGGSPYQGSYPPPYPAPSMPQNYPTSPWVPYPMPYPYQIPAPPVNPYVFNCEGCRFPIDYSQAFGSIIECPSCSETKYLTPPSPNGPQVIMRVLNCTGCGSQIIWEEEWYCKECHENNVHSVMDQSEKEASRSNVATSPT